jgi:uncharacterized membrane protein YhhN
VTTLSFVFLLLVAAMAVLDWVAVARESAVLEYVSKPAATAGIFGVAASLDVVHGASWWWLLVALVFCLLGDVFLMLPRDAFIPGLASFAVAQMMFAVSFVANGIDGGQLVLGVVLITPLAVLLARRFVGSMLRGGHSEFAAPVIVYLVVISAMAVAAVAGGSVVAIAGALMFMLSDSLIAESRFVKERNWHGVGIMVTYHLALVGLALGPL